MNSTAHYPIQIHCMILIIAGSFVLYATDALSLDLKNGDGFRHANLSIPRGGQPGFTFIPPSQSGITFSNLLSNETVANNRLTESGSGVELGDVDGDGNLELFSVAHALASHYPEPATSHLLTPDGAGWIIMQTFSKIGLVNGVVFTDINTDGDPDLALACEWDSIRVFKNNRGILSEASDTLGFTEFKGRWNGIAV